MAEGASFRKECSALLTHQITNRDLGGNEGGLGEPKLLGFFATQGERKAVSVEGRTLEVMRQRYPASAEVSCFVGVLFT